MAEFLRDNWTAISVAMTMALGLCRWLIRRWRGTQTVGLLRRIVGFVVAVWERESMAAMREYEATNGDYWETEARAARAELVSVRIELWECLRGSSAGSRSPSTGGLPPSGLIPSEPLTLPESGRNG